MLFGFALIFLCGLLAGTLFRRMHLPSLVGMLLAGVLLGPHMLNLLDETILGISGDLRQIALIIILTRAGLSLKVDDLRRVGRAAVLMCFVPATLELIGVILLAPPILGLSRMEAAVLGTVLAAVSPAVIVPRMVRLMDEGYGTQQSIPQMILAGASVDDVYVLVLFTSFSGLAAGGSAAPMDFVKIPTALMLGVAGGALCGWLLDCYFRRVHLRDSLKVVILLSFSFILITIERNMQGVIGFSGILAVMSMGIVLMYQNPTLSKRLSAKYDRLWVGAELLLFVLVGAMVNIRYAAKAGVPALLLIFGVLLFRMVGVCLCLLGTSLRPKERLFCMLAYLPKATVQAAIGAIPLSMGLPCGEIVLTVSVLAILITAPLGAFAIDLTYQKWLSPAQERPKVS